MGLLCQSEVLPYGTPLRYTGHPHRRGGCAVMDTIFYILCTSIPCHIIVFYQYWVLPWRSKRLAAGLACANVLAKLWAITMWIHILPVGLRAIELFFSLLGMLIYLFLIRTNPFKLLFTYVLILDYLMVVRGIASFLSIRLFSADAQSWYSILICLLLYLVTMPFVLRYFRNAALQASQTNAPALWRTIWLVPALTSTVVLLYTDAFQENSAGNWTFLMARLSLLVCVILVCLMLLKTLHNLQHQAVLEERARQTEYILSLQRSQYLELQTYLEEVRRARHDLRQHHKVIQSCLDTGNLEQLREYLRAQAPPPQEVRGDYCKNYAVNMLLNHYAAQFTAAKVDFTCRADLPDRLSVSEPDLCVVVGNLLENALEACTGQEHAHIRAALRCDGGRAITLAVDNTAPTPPKEASDGAFFSTKHPGWGIGTQSIRRIAQHYHGVAQFRWEKGVFYASVFLNPQTEAPEPGKQKR